MSRRLGVGAVPRAVVLTVALALGLTATTGCTRIRNTQGYVVDEQLFTSIAPGVDNKESVLKTLGRPSLASEWDDREWYYVSRQTTQLAFLQPKPAQQRILVISFDEQGNVTKVSERGLEQVARIDPEDDETPTLGRETGIIEDLFGNIGRVGSVGGASGETP